MHHESECAECRRAHAHSGPALQTARPVSRPGDPYEREAERVAEAAFGAAPPQGTLHRGLSREADGPTDTAAGTGSVDEVLSSAGQPLDRAVRSLMESRLGHDFGQVRVHTDTRADASARAVRARAYTVGRHVVFRAGEYVPHSRAGQRLLTHELVHVVQQGAAERGTGAGTGGGIRERVARQSAAMLMRVPGEEWADWCSPCVFGSKMCHAEADIAPERCKHLYGSWYRCPCK